MNRQHHRETACVGRTVGALAGWLALLETGLVHRGDPLALLAQVTVVLLSAVGVGWVLSRASR